MKKFNYKSFAKSVAFFLGKILLLAVALYLIWNFPLVMLLGFKSITFVHALFSMAEVTILLSVLRSVIRDEVRSVLEEELEEEAKADELPVTVKEGA